MTPQHPQLSDLILDVEQHIEVHAPIADVFRSVLHRLGEGNTTPDGKTLNMHLEEWAGGRWYRDRGNGIGHLWGHVQVIKPPVLLELSGPMFMSYPAINHMEMKLEEVGRVVKVTLRHRAIGMIDPGHRAGVGMGWGHMLQQVAADFAATPARKG